MAVFRHFTRRIDEGNTLINPNGISRETSSQDAKVTKPGAGISRVSPLCWFLVPESDEASYEIFN